MQCHNKQHSERWKNVNGVITCNHSITEPIFNIPMEVTKRFDVCVLCYLQVQLEKVKDITESLPEIGSALYDDAVTDVFNAADNAHHLLEHEHGEE